MRAGFHQQCAHTHTRMWLKMEDLGGRTCCLQTRGLGWFLTFESYLYVRVHLNLDRNLHTIGRSSRQTHSYPQILGAACMHWPFGWRACFSHQGSSQISCLSTGAPRMAQRFSFGFPNRNQPHKGYPQQKTGQMELNQPVWGWKSGAPGKCSLRSADHEDRKL